MFDRHVKVSWVAIYIGWISSFAIWGASWATQSDDLGRLSILVVAAVATVTVREFFVEHDRKVKNIIRVLRLGEPESEHARLRPLP